MICFYENEPQIPILKSQIPNNIQIKNSNNKTFQSLKRCSATIVPVLNFGHWYLFEPALARLDRHKPSSVAKLRLVLISTFSVHPVWARDLVFGAWNFNFHLASIIREISQLPVYLFK